MPLLCHKTGENWEKSYLGPDVSSNLFSSGVSAILTTT
jgi:hypothetical protein